MVRRILFYCNRLLSRYQRFVCDGLYSSPFIHLLASLLLSALSLRLLYFLLGLFDFFFETFYFFSTLPYMDPSIPLFGTLPNLTSRFNSERPIFR